MTYRGSWLAVTLALVLGGAGCAAPAETSSEPRVPLVGPPLSYADDPRAIAAISFAQAQVGKRYCWGGRGPQCFDCSGLVQAAWRHAGISLPRTAAAQGDALPDIPVDQVRPGDILWWPTHVGLYIGGGQMIDAYHSGAGVVRRPAVRPRKVLRVDARAPAMFVASHGH